MSTHWTATMEHPSRKTPGEPFSLEDAGAGEKLYRAPREQMAETPPRSADCAPAILDAALARMRADRFFSPEQIAGLWVSFKLTPGVQRI